jgi:heme-degrading monooxygenase HmoA
MFVRLVKSNLKPNTIAEATQTFESKIIPILQKAKGFQDAIALAGTNGNEMVSITLWDLKENAEAYSNSTYPEALKTLSNVLEGTPYVKTYEIASSTISKFAPHATV